MRWSLLPAMLAVVMVATAGAPYESFPELRGPWLGQEPPGDQPVVFAPGIVKPPEGFHSTVVFNAAGDEAYWTGMASGKTYQSRFVDGVWTAPVLLEFDLEFGVREPMPAHDDTRLYYLSRRPLPHDPVNRERIWYVERDGDGWSARQPIDPIVSAHPTHWQFSLTTRGDLYFTSEIDGPDTQDIFVARLRGDDRYEEPVRLGPGVNTEGREFCPFIDPDERYLIFSRSMPGWRSDLFVSFRGENGEWKPAVNMGETLNLEHNETSPVVTADGRYLFFLRVSSEVNDAFWVSASILDSFRE